MGSAFTLQPFHMTPPVAGDIAVLAVTATPLFCDLGTGKAAQADDGGSNPGFLNKEIVIYNDGANNAYVNFGPTKASVVTANVPDSTTASAVDATTGAITNNAKNAFAIPSGQALQVRPTGAGSRYMGYSCAAGLTTTLRIGARSR